MRILIEPGRFMVLFPVFKENDIDPVMLSLNTFVSATFCIKASLSNASLFSFFATWFVVVVLFTATAVLLSFTSCFFAPQALSNNTAENIVIAFNCSCLRCLLFIPFIIFTFLFYPFPVLSGFRSISFAGRFHCRNALFIILLYISFV